MISAQQLDALEPQMRQAMLSLLAEIRAKDELIAQRDREAAFKQALIDKLTHEMAVLKRLKFAATRECRLLRFITDSWPHNVGHEIRHRDEKLQAQRAQLWGHLWGQPQQPRAQSRATKKNGLALVELTR